QKNVKEPLGTRQQKPHLSPMSSEVTHCASSARDPFLPLSAQQRVPGPKPTRTHDCDRFHNLTDAHYLSAIALDILQIRKEWAGGGGMFKRSSINFHLESRRTGVPAGE